MMANILAKHCSIYKVWSRENIERWEHQRSNGVIKFVLIEGVFKWGLLAAAIFLTMKMSVKEVTPQQIVITCLVWFVGAIFYGFFLWLGTSLSYAKQLNSRNNL